MDRPSLGASGARCRVYSGTKRAMAKWPLLSARFNCRLLLSRWREASPHQFLPDLKYWPYLLRDFLLFALLGMAVGFIAAWLRRRRRQMLAAHKNSVTSALGVIAPWVIVIANAIFAGLGIWAISRQYGESTAGFDAAMPTPGRQGKLRIFSGC